MKTRVDRLAVQSSMFASIGYSKDSATLEVEFVDGEIYHFFAVPAAVHEEFVKAESKGVFFRREIKTAYAFVRV